MTPSEQKFSEALNKMNSKIRLIKFEESTKTSQDAANALNMSIDQIGKSVVFKTEKGKFLLIIASGAEKINENLIEKEINEKIIKTTPQEIKEYVGYPIGGIPPFAHDNPMKIFFDKKLLKFDKIFCAGGTPNLVFETTPEEILKITSAKILNVN